MRSRLWLPFAATAATLLSFTATSCGPSVQSIYEGDVRFEHCYRLDLEQDVAITHRQACWKTWLDRYTYGQSRDKLEYARRRVRAFAGGDVDRPQLRIGEGGQQRDARQFYLVVPAPTSVHAPPPPIATRMNAVEPAPATAPTVAASPSSSAELAAKIAPGESCASECHGAFNSCNQACDPVAKSTACKSCDPDYKKCMQRCFE
ncbi:MAG TPA: hypothetical protein VEQ58_15800 [Polyangiaceae bacterium]|nr:hypothetical protein [Polyangiaceae bacterium]